jgi:3',5'-cyclic AMP phosphodiesterase CpdA
MLLYPSLLKTLGKLETSIYYTAGNHDITSIVDGPELQYLTYNKYIGPTYFSFNYGNVHFVILESVKWDGYRYYGEFGEKQLHWLKNDLKYVKKDKLVFFIMHIPIIKWNGLDQFTDLVNDKNKFLSIVKDFKNSLIIAGHTHTIEKIYSKDYLKYSDKSLEIPIILAGAVSGDRWRGEVDEYGIPYSRMKDGSPKGYYLLAINNNKFKETYKMPGRTNSDQMDVYFVDNNTKMNNSFVLYNENSNLNLVINVFNGDIYSKVLYSLNDKNYMPMTRKILADPLFYNQSGYTKTYKCFHIWSTILSGLEKGVNKITIKCIDKNDNVFEKIKLLEVK